MQAALKTALVLKVLFVTERSTSASHHLLLATAKSPALKIKAVKKVNVCPNAHLLSKIFGLVHPNQREDSVADFPASTK